jgi:tRNA(His) guanylyltransferase
MGNKQDSLGDRMKAYEDVNRSFLIPRSYTLLRVDGKAFHTYTKNLDKPFDFALNEDLNKTAIYLCENIQNAKLAYIQSDEITILLTDFENLNTDQYFSGNIQKIVSVVASMAAAKFNSLRIERYQGFDLPLGVFDCRVFQVPSAIEAFNAIYWRWKDCEKNSISQVAYANFPHKELHGKTGAEKQEMLMMQKGINWSKYDESLKNGRFIVKQVRQEPLGFGHDELVERSEWLVQAGWKISQNKKKLWDLIPKMETELSFDEKKI